MAINREKVNLMLVIINRLKVNMATNSKLSEVIRNVVNSTLGVKPEEEFVIISDIKRIDLAKIFFEIGIERRANVTLAIMAPSSLSGKSLTKAARSLLLNSDVFIIPMSKKILFIDAIKEAVYNGSRGAILPEVTMESFLSGAINIDYLELENSIEEIAKKLKESSTLKILSTDGSELTVDIKEAMIVKDTGIYNKRGSWGELPAGEAKLIMLKGEVNGEILVNGSISGLGALGEPVRLVIGDRIIKEVHGGTLITPIKEKIEKANYHFDMFEIGIGLNRGARLTGKMFEDSKIYGALHIAFGKDMEIYLECVLLKSTLISDGEVIVREGKPQLSS